ncbi:GIY-YIG nuclease family protein [Stagnihabitans tardus]|uniref:GIY-YIG domain-containing protein n=1 Tax=Stagnihabitans tardus TaxID=2699202 RepID=A0AAE4YDH1_9RHOB|nr:GIY-YIG nuclease family protein [Stagnihabitans tardus]NBZ87585.1 hypothetical protein [Stagnihabitans tardus]
MMENEALSVADLVRLGFCRIGRWTLTEDALGHGATDAHPDREKILATSHALYAFATGEKVLYIGKTAQGLARRLAGYSRPGATQATNRKCHGLIRAATLRGEAIDLYGFAPPTDMAFLGFPVDLAAGLEDVLIRRFRPAWNGGGAQSVRRAIHVGEPPSAEKLNSEQATFSIALSATYWEKGIVNPGVAVSDLFGATDADLTISCALGMLAANRQGADQSAPTCATFVGTKPGQSSQCGLQLLAEPARGLRVGTPARSKGPEPSPPALSWRMTIGARLRLCKTEVLAPGAGNGSSGLYRPQTGISAFEAAAHIISHHEQGLLPLREVRRVFSRLFNRLSQKTAGIAHHPRVILVHILTEQ